MQTIWHAKALNALAPEVAACRWIRTDWDRVDSSVAIAYCFAHCINPLILRGEIAPDSPALVLNNAAANI